MPVPLDQLLLFLPGSILTYLPVFVTSPGRSSPQIAFLAGVVLIAFGLRVALEPR